MEKIDDIGIGVRGTLKEFKHKYTVEFLQKHGYTRYTYYPPFYSQPKVIVQTVNTKYGEIVVNNNSMITYVGGRVWSVSRDENNQG